MHDLHLANKIANLAKHNAENRGLVLKRIKVALGDMKEHGENINHENLLFNLKLLLGDDVEINIERIKADNWELVEIEGE